MTMMEEPVTPETDRPLLLLLSSQLDLNPFATPAYALSRAQAISRAGACRTYTNLSQMPKFSSVQFGGLFLRTRTRTV